MVDVCVSVFTHGRRNPVRRTSRVPRVGVFLSHLCPSNIGWEESGSRFLCRFLLPLALKHMCVCVCVCWCIFCYILTSSTLTKQATLQTRGTTTESFSFVSFYRYYHFFQKEINVSRPPSLRLPRTTMKTILLKSTNLNGSIRGVACEVLQNS